jgi:ribosomal protein S18 acetylase RimI-like enzyme
MRARSSPGDGPSTSAPSPPSAAAAAAAAARWRVRLVTPRDAGAVAELQAAAFHEALPLPLLGDLAFASFRAEVRDALRQKMGALDDEAFVLLVAESDDGGGGPLGVIELTLLADADVLRHLPGSARYAYISSMAVAAASRRRGMASALLDAAHARAAAWDQPVALHVYDDNATALACYRAAGYEEVARDPGWRKLVGGRVRVLMILRRPRSGSA